MSVVEEITQTSKDTIKNTFDNIKKHFDKEWSNFKKQYGKVTFKIINDEGDILETKTEEINIEPISKSDSLKSIFAVDFQDKKSEYRWRQAASMGTAGTGIDPYEGKKIQVIGDNRKQDFEKIIDE